MNDEMQGKMIEILSSIQDATKSAGDFTLTQLPDIAQSYVVYGRAVSAFYMLVCLIVSAILLSVSRWAYKNPWNNSTLSYDKDAKRGDSNEMVMGISFVTGIVFLCISVFSFNFLVWFAPKVWLLKELAALLK